MVTSLVHRHVVPSMISDSRGLAGDGAKLDVFDFTLTGGEMARIAAMDTGATLFFDHRDPAMVSAIGNRPIHD